MISYLKYEAIETTYHNFDDNLQYSYIPLRVFQHPRFGVIMEKRDLLKILTTIESAIINPPMLDFSNGYYLLQKSYTIKVDNKVADFWSNLGFLTGKSLPNINMLCDLLDNYIQIRMELINQGIVYDPNMIIRSKIINFVKQFATITFDAKYIQSIIQMHL
jgi:hypothetical protein